MKKIVLILLAFVFVLAFVVPNAEAIISARQLSGIIKTNVPNYWQLPTGNDRDMAIVMRASNASKPAGIYWKYNGTWSIVLVAGTNMLSSITNAMRTTMDLKDLAIILAATNRAKAYALAQDTTATLAMVAEMIAKDTTATLAMVAEMIAKDTAVTNAMVAEMIAKDTAVTNAMVAEMIAKDTVITNAMVAEMIAKDTVCTDASRAYAVVQDTIATNAARAYAEYMLMNSGKYTQFLGISISTNPLLATTMQTDIVSGLSGMAPGIGATAAAVTFTPASNAVYEIEVSFIAGISNAAAGYPKIGLSINGAIYDQNMLPTPSATITSNSFVNGASTSNGSYRMVAKKIYRTTGTGYASLRIAIMMGHAAINGGYANAIYFRERMIVIRRIR